MRWDELKASQPLSPAGKAAYEDEARIHALQGLVHRLRSDAAITQAELAERMGTTQSASPAWKVVVRRAS